MDIAENFDGEVDKVKKVETLGSLRLRHHETHEIILIPTPTRDPNDPLNWYWEFHCLWFIDTDILIPGRLPSSTMSQL